MPITTILTGLALILIGVGFFVGTGSEHETALIPVIPGLLILLAGAFAFKPNLRMHLIHGALVLALLTVIGVLVQRAWTITAAEAAQLLSVLVCVAYIAVGVQSFLAARRKRKAEAAGESS